MKLGVLSLASALAVVSIARAGVIVCNRSEDSVGESGGTGYLRDLDGRYQLVNDPARTHEKYLR